MAYAKNELSKLGGGFIEDSAQVWLYLNSAADSLATVKGSLYFSDGDLKGMKIGDLVIVYLLNGASSIVYFGVVTVLTAGSGCTIASNVSITT